MPIGALAVILLASLHVAVPETVTGLIGLTLIGLLLVSSIRHNRGRMAYGLLKPTEVAGMLGVTVRTLWGMPSGTGSRNRFV